MKHKLSLNVLLFAAVALFAMLGSVNFVQAQTTETCVRQSFSYGTYTVWSITGQGCSAVGSTRVFPGTEAPAPQPTQPAPTVVPVFAQPTIQPSNRSGGTVQVPSAGGTCASLGSQADGSYCSQSCNPGGPPIKVIAGSCTPWGGISIGTSTYDGGDENTIQSLSFGEASSLSVSYTCGYSVHVYPYLQSSRAGVNNAVTYFELSVSEQGGMFWSMAAYSLPQSVFVPIFFETLTATVVFTDGSHVITSMIVSDCNSGGAEYVPSTDVVATDNNNMAKDACMATPYGYFTDTGLPCTP